MVLDCIKQPYSLIEHTLFKITLQCRHWKEHSPHPGHPASYKTLQLLVVAPSNKAVDVVLLQLLSAGFKSVLRVGNPVEITSDEVWAALDLWTPHKSITILPHGVCVCLSSAVAVRLDGVVIHQRTGQLAVRRALKG